MTLSRKADSGDLLQISPVSERASCKWGLLPKSMLHKLYPWDYKPSSRKAQEETQETLQKLNSTAQRNLCANKHQKLIIPTQSSPTSLSLTMFLINPNRPHPDGPCDGWPLCPGWGRENSHGLFHGFMGPYFMGIFYSVVQVIFKAASHPLIPLSSPHLTIGWKRFS